jgi:hypothetical protein
MVQRDGIFRNIYGELLDSPELKRQGAGSLALNERNYGDLFPASSRAIEVAARPCSFQYHDHSGLGVRLGLFRCKDPYLDFAASADTPVSATGHKSLLSPRREMPPGFVLLPKAVDPVAAPPHQNPLSFCALRTDFS